MQSLTKVTPHNLNKVPITSACTSMAPPLVETHPRRCRPDKARPRSNRMVYNCWSNRGRESRSSCCRINGSPFNNEGPTTVKPPCCIALWNYGHCVHVDMYLDACVRMYVVRVLRHVFTSVGVRTQLCTYECNQVWSSLFIPL